MKNYTSMVRADGSITIPAMLRIQMGIRPRDLVNIEPDRNSGTIKITIHHVQPMKGENNHGNNEKDNR